MLEKMPMFDGLSAEQIARLEGVGRVDEVAEGARIFSEGDRADGLYVIVDGAVVITHKDHDSQIELSRLGPGEFFGELALFDGAPRSASATAVAPSHLFVLGSTVFSSLIAVTSIRAST